MQGISCLRNSEAWQRAWHWPIPGVQGVNEYGWMIRAQLPGAFLLNWEAGGWTIQIYT